MTFGQFEKNSLQGRSQKENPCRSVRSNVSKWKSRPNLEQSSLGSQQTGSFQMSELNALLE